MANSKFASVSNEEIKRLLDSKDAAATQRTIKRSVSAFREFLGNKGVSTEFEVLSKTDLDGHLKLFFASVRSQKGEDVKTTTLNSYRYGISKYLKENCSIDINADIEFASSRQLFKAKVTDLKKVGKGSIDHKPAIDPEDLHKLYDNDNLVFNINTPCGLQRKVWFEIMYFLCRRGRENLREMTQSTFGIGKDAKGQEYVYQIVDEADKNHRSVGAPDETVGEARMYERKGDPMCPVVSFKLYLSKLNPNLDALWQRPLDSFESSQPTWYYKAPLGKNPLSVMMSDISKAGKLSKIYTNHCVRATSITPLDNAGVEARHIMRASGHKSESSIRSYACRLTEDKKRQMSDHLSNTLFSDGESQPKVGRLEENKENDSSLDFSEISEDQLLNIFSDQNIFVELNPTLMDSNTTTAAMDLVNPQPQNSVAMNTNNMFSTGGFIQGSSNARNTNFLVNPNISGGTVHFHFHGGNS